MAWLRATVWPCSGATFLELVGAASFALTALAQDSSEPSATVLFADRATAVAPVRHDPNDPATLWVRQQDLPPSTTSDQAEPRAARTSVFHRT